MDMATELDLAHMRAGFADPVHDAQRTFRCVLDALARPGRALSLPVAVAPPAGLSAAQCAVLLALADCDTPVWLPPALRGGEAGHFLRFHCGCRLAGSLGEAHFVVLDGLDALPRLDALRLGEPAYPDRSATLLIEVGALADSGSIRLRGPGIREVRTVGVGGWTPRTEEFLGENHARFPLGVDLLLTRGDRLMGLPRTTSVEA